MKAYFGVGQLTKSVIVFLALWAGMCRAAPPTWLPPEELPHGTALLQVEELKAIYMQCDRLSSVSFLDSSTAANCSVAAENLRRMGFDGRADAVLNWWKAMSEDRRAAAPNDRVEVKTTSASL